MRVQSTTIPKLYYREDSGVNNFKKLNKEFGINEVQYFYEFMGLDEVDLTLAKSSEFFANIVALEWTKHYKYCNKSLIELIVYSSPPTEYIDRTSWILILERLWDLYD
jgi:hypothetical protein